MSWLKKQLSKLFHEVEEEYEIDITQYNDEIIHKEIDQQNKKPFKFPNLTDMKREEVVQVEQATAKKEYSSFDEEGKIQLPQHLRQDGGVSKVYDVEVSGIRDLLENRRGKKPSRKKAEPPTSKERSTSLEEQLFLTKETVKVPVKKEEPLKENRKKFVPTHVPSPVHGFRKTPDLMPKTPATIEDLMQKKQTESQASTRVAELTAKLETETLYKQDQHEIENLLTKTEEMSKAASVYANEEKDEQDFIIHAWETNKEQVIELASTPNEAVSGNIVEAEVAETVEEELKQVAIDSDTIDESASESPLEQLLEVNEIVEAKEQATILEEQPQEELPDLQKVQVEQMMFTNSTIHIENVTLAEPAQLSKDALPIEVVKPTNTVDEQAVEEEPSTIEEAPVPKSSGSRLPFNVLMLKSDKEKLASKQKPQLPSYEQIGLSQAAIYTAPERVTENVQVTLQPQEEDVTELKQLLNEPEDEGTQHSIQEVFQDPIETKEVPIVQPMASPIETVDVPTQAIQAQQIMAQQKADAKASLENVLLNEPKPYHKPPMDILAPAEAMTEDTEWMEEQGENLVEALSHFQVQAQVESVVQGPAVTQFEITVGHGTKVSKVRNLSDDIQLALAARDIRIDAPIPGKRSIGIEIPNRMSRAVRLSEVTTSEAFTKSDSPLEAALGLDLNGKPVTLDLRKMPHGLIAGATGSGKSVCINSILVSLLYKSAPHELKLMLIDPKMVELAPFNHIPHLVSPVITDVKAATEALKWAVEEMERRYQLFMHSGTRDITRYNKLCDENGMLAQKLPYLLIVIDELADLMMMSPADVELAISRLAQKARACGIHLILATQRPSVDVITGTLKSNIPTRIAFAVSSQIDSRTIIDSPGAERLLGRGDMLYLGNGMNAPQRIQGTFVTDEEIEEVVEYVRSQGEPNYFFKSEELVQRSEVIEEQDELFEEVCRYVYSQGSASTSALQRKYHIGYNRAARLIDLLESHGFISEQKGSKPRDVYITETILENTFG
jgi:DNA segregation ATPase FtsK/SpoIIIE, S-DNA-T family